MKKGNKKMSTQRIGELNANAVESWLSDNPVIPQSKGKPNRSAISRKFGITKSTWESNSRLKALWTKIQGRFVPKSNMINSSKSNTKITEDDVIALLNKKDDMIIQLQAELARTKSNAELLRRNLAAEELLILTGRYIPYNVLKDDSELDSELILNNEIT
ncbi:hypothetical protein [Colwellia demingiae]|nr:hypothetical protein [Colwellia demingiae]